MKVPPVCFLALCLLCGFLFFCFVEPLSAESRSDSLKKNTTNVVILPIWFFRTYISKADGDRCVMAPTCSRFALDAIHKHGLVIGWIMTADRLMRCGGDEKKVSRSIRKRGRLFIDDPVRNNDFWWYLGQ